MVDTSKSCEFQAIMLLIMPSDRQEKCLHVFCLYLSLECMTNAHVSDTVVLCVVKKYRFYRSFQSMRICFFHLNFSPESENKRNFCTGNRVIENIETKVI